MRLEKDGQLVEDGSKYCRMVRRRRRRRRIRGRKMRRRRNQVAKEEEKEAGRSRHADTIASY